MTGKHKKQFGVWMDSTHATVIGREHVNEGDFVVLGHTKNHHSSGHSTEHSVHNAQKTELHKFFKDVTHYMQNAEEVHIIGPSTIQEQFIHYLKDTAQFKNTHASEGTSNKMSDEKLIEFFSKRFH